LVTGDDAVMQRIEIPARPSGARTKAAPRRARPTRRLSATAEPTMTTPRDHRRRRDLNSPGHSSAPVSSLISPLLPKSAQGLPVRASSAITRTSLVPMNSRARQAALSANPRR
jgi:hypothetical protein